MSILPGAVSKGASEWIGVFKFLDLLIRERCRRVVECGCLLSPYLVLERSCPVWRMVSFSQRRVVDASSVFGQVGLWGLFQRRVRRGESCCVVAVALTFIALLWVIGVPVLRRRLMFRLVIPAPLAGHLVLTGGLIYSLACRLGGASSLCGLTATHVLLRVALLPKSIRINVTGDLVMTSQKVHT
ncbi:hypothetical protein YC2023_024632 [Brassica napus]